MVEANDTTVNTYVNATATGVLQQQQQQQQDKSSTILYSRSTSDNKSSIRNYNDMLNKLNPLLLKVIVGTRLAIHWKKNDKFYSCKVTTLRYNDDGRNYTETTLDFMTIAMKR